METNIFEISTSVIWVEPDMIAATLYDTIETWTINLIAPYPQVLQTTIACT